MSPTALQVEGPAPGVARLVVSVPQPQGILDGAGLEALAAALAAVGPEVGCVILTGAGRSFVAGPEALEPALEAAATAALAALAGCPAPTLAAVNGACLGLGANLALACDLVYAREGARFGAPVAVGGQAPMTALAARVGPMRATELLLTGRQVPGVEACALGLCLDLFEPEALDARCLALAESIAARGNLGRVHRWFGSDLRPRPR